MIRTYSRLIVSILTLFIVSCTGRKHEESTTSPQNAHKKIYNKFIKPKLYLEYSGSMFPYDGNNVRGQFKNTIGTLVNNLETVKDGSTSVFIVNDDVYPYKNSVSKIIKSTTLFDEKIGDHTYTDFEKIFQKILQDLKNDEVAFLFTDLIYSDKDINKQKNPYQIFNSAQQLCQSVFSKYSSNTSVIVVQLESDFSGKYFSPIRMGKGGTYYNGSRPYYMLVLAKNPSMEQLLYDDRYSSVVDFDDLPEYRNSLLFSNSSILNSPNYRIIQNESVGSFKKSVENRAFNKDGIHAIEDVEWSKGKKEALTLCVAMTLPKNLMNSYVKDIKNYHIESPKDGFVLRKITSENSGTNTTYKLFLDASNPNASGERELRINLKNTFPKEWVSSTNSNDDTNINDKNFQNQTFGLLYLLKGVNLAFDSHNPNKDYYFTLTLKLN